MAIVVHAPRGRYLSSEGWLDLGSTPVVPDPDPDPDPPDPEGWPTLANTGPRYSFTSVHNGTYTTSVNGEVLDRMQINGRLVIQHDNVKVTDCLISTTGRYKIEILRHATRNNDLVGVEIDYCGIDGLVDSAEDNRVAFYGFAGGWKFEHSWIDNVDRAMIVRRGGRVAHCYINNTNGFSGSHRTAIQHHGGQSDHGGIEIVHNSLRCVGTGTSSALSLYADNGPVTDVLVENNILAASGNYLMYGGESGSSYIRILDNHWSTKQHPTGGSSGTLTAFSGGGTGNVQSGNVMNSTDDPWE